MTVKRNRSESTKGINDSRENKCLEAREKLSSVRSRTSPKEAVEKKCDVTFQAWMEVCILGKRKSEFSKQESNL